MKRIAAIIACSLLIMAILVSCGFEEEQQRVIANVYLPDVEAFNTAFYAEHNPNRDMEKEEKEEQIQSWLPIGTYYYDQSNGSSAFSATFEVTSIDLSINTAYFSYIIKEPGGKEFVSDGIVSAGCERMTEKGKRIIKIYVDGERCLEFSGVSDVESAVYRRNSTKYKLVAAN